MTLVQVGITKISHLVFEVLTEITWITEILDIVATSMKSLGEYQLEKCFSKY